MFVDSTLVRGLAPAGEEVFDEVPAYEDDDHHGDGGGEVPPDRGVCRRSLEYIDVHPEEGGDLEVSVVVGGGPGGTHEC